MAEQDNPQKEPGVGTQDEAFAFNGDHKIRAMRQDRTLFFLGLVAAISAFLIILLLIAPIIHFLLLRLGFVLPFISGIFGWLDDGLNGLLVTIGLAFVAAIALVLLRRRILKNPLFYVDSGCPVCREHELVRIRRQRSDRMFSFIGVPAQRRQCRNCLWQGLRVSGSAGHANKMDAEEAALPPELG